MHFLVYIKTLSEAMQPGALLCITTGDISSVTAKIRKEKWRLIIIPEHLHYFSSKTLGQLLTTYGFEIIYNRYCGFYRSIDYTFNSLSVLKNRMEWVYKLIEATGIGKYSFYLNLFDIMYIIARKKQSA